MTLPDDTGTGTPARVARLSYFFPARNEEANLEGLVEEALATLPSIAETFEIIAVNDGSKDRTAEIADRLAAAHPGVVRVVHHAVNRGYGGALRSGFEASRYELLAFTDGDRQFRVADLGRLTTRLAAADRPDVVVGYRIKRADPIIRVMHSFPAGRSLGYLVEASLGAGGLIVCALGLNHQWPEARYLLARVCEYAAGDAFWPEMTLTEEAVAGLRVALSL